MRRVPGQIDLYHFFMERRTSVESDEHPVRPLKSRNTGTVEMCHLMKADRRFIIEKHFDKMGISVGSCHAILTEI